MVSATVLNNLRDACIYSVINYTFCPSFLLPSTDKKTQEELMTIQVPVLLC